jgi:hypothetical protein
LGHVPTFLRVPIIPPITRETIDKYTEDVAVDDSLMQRELGFVPQYDLKAGWEETIREMLLENPPASPFSKGDLSELVENFHQFNKFKHPTVKPKAFPL